MAFQFQYNKTALQRLRKQLAMREGALPVLKNKESALRAEVQRCRREKKEAGKRRQAAESEGQALHALMARFAFGRMRLEKLRLSHRRIAGVNVPEFEGLDLRFDPLPEHLHPIWTADAVALVQQLAEARFAERVLDEQLAILERERKRTTQKVNLYEKVQIPELEDALKKIKRFLEDKDNLSKAAQKMVKARLARAEMERAVQNSDSTGASKPRVAP